jgi:hypothetical protein
MAAGTFVLFDHFKEALGTASIDLSSATLMCALLSSGYTPSSASDSAWAGISSNEMGTSGYAAQQLSSVEWSRIGSNAVRFDAADTVISAQSTMTAKYAVIYAQTSGKLIGYFDLDSASGSGVDATQITVQWNANGLFDAS